MIAWKIWHDLQKRFYGVLFFVIAIAIMHVALFPLTKGFLNWADIDTSKWPGLKNLVENYGTYTDWRWFHEIERNVLFGIILALGGILTESRQRTIQLTLSLPASRRKWLSTQFGIVLGLLFALNFIALPILMAGGFIHQQQLGIGRSFLNTLLLTLTAAPYIGMTFLFASITGDSIRAFLYSFAFLVFSNRLDYFIAIDRWMPETLMTKLWTPEFPWQPIVTILFLTSISFAAAIFRFEKTDY
jgi:ABC-type transport system involved in multi-copper enzyme maturation permease subunit